MSERADAGNPDAPARRLVRRGAWIGLVAGVVVGVWALYWLLVPPELSQSRPPGAGAAGHAGDASQKVVARFVGTIGEIGLPRRPLKVIPIGYDPNFVQPV